MVTDLPTAIDHLVIPRKGEALTWESQQKQRLS